MRDVTREMIHIYVLKKLGYDFMGYEFNNTGQLSYHHLVVPKRLGGEYSIENGAILRQNTSHDYLHRIERVDFDAFSKITSEMIDENHKGYLDPKNLLMIDSVLTSFEREHCSDRTSKGKPLIKEQYTRRLIRKL